MVIRDFATAIYDVRSPMRKLDYCRRTGGAPVTEVLLVRSRRPPPLRPNPPGTKLTG